MALALDCRPAGLPVTCLAARNTGFIFRLLTRNLRSVLRKLCLILSLPPRDFCFIGTAAGGILIGNLLLLRCHPRMLLFIQCSGAALAFLPFSQGFAIGMDDR